MSVQQRDQAQAKAVVLSVDVMGGDHGPKVTLPAVRLFLERHPNAACILVGTQAALAAFEHPRARKVFASQVVSMEDSVELALRKKRDSSMRVALAQICDAGAHATVSAGNTGALMALSRYVLKTLDGIDRPAISTQLPNAKGKATTVLDLGANVDCEPPHLLQFARMATALDRVLKAIPHPSVGLLNIGEEIIKGNETIKTAGELMRHAHELGQIHFFGNVEGDDIFKGTTDIVVCDGFVGNVALKTTEGVASMISGFLKAEFNRNVLTKIAGLIALPVLQSLRRRVDHRRYNGAALLGLRGLVFKSHGAADVASFGHALARAHEAAARDLLGQLQKGLSSQEHFREPSDHIATIDSPR